MAPFSVDSAVVDTKKKEKPRRAASMSSMMSMDDEELTAEQRQCTKALREGKRYVHPPAFHSPPSPPWAPHCVHAHTFPTDCLHLLLWFQAFPPVHLVFSSLVLEAYKRAGIEMAGVG